MLFVFQKCENTTFLKHATKILMLYAGKKDICHQLMKIQVA